MTTMLDDNLRRLFRECTPPQIDLDRALARFEARRRPTHARFMAAVAAVLLMGALAFWLAPASPPQVPAQAEDLDRLIRELGAPETREKAKARLLEIGPAALKPLERALYHDDPEVRVASQIVAKAVRRQAEIQAPLAFVRASIKIARARWTARDFTDFEPMVEEAFNPLPPTTVRYVPRKTVGDSFDATKKDQLTPFLVEALQKNDGIVFADPAGNVVDLSPLVIFTLPDKVGWSAYVVAKIPELQDAPAALRIAALIATEDGGLLLRRSLAPHAGGGREIVRIDFETGLKKVLKKGDVLRSPDLDRIGDAGKYVLEVERQGKSFILELAVVERVVVRLTGPASLKAADILESADAAWAANDLDKALELYTTMLSKYNGSDLLTKERRVQVLDRVATLMEKKSKK